MQWYDPSRRKRPTAKIMKCSSTRLACDFVARGDSEEQVMAQAAEHARKDPGMQTIPPEVAAKVKAAIRKE
jgi:predicted small metal-binding protein